MWFNCESELISLLLFFQFGWLSLLFCSFFPSKYLKTKCKLQCHLYRLLTEQNIVSQFLWIKMTLLSVVRAHFVYSIFFLPAHLSHGDLRPQTTRQIVERSRPLRRLNHFRSHSNIFCTSHLPPQTTQWLEQHQFLLDRHVTLRILTLFE